MFIGSWLFIVQTLNSTTYHLLAQRFHSAACYAPTLFMYFYGKFQLRLLFSCFLHCCVCVFRLLCKQNAKVAPNKNLTMSLFLISPSFRPYNVVFISGGSVEGFCLRLRYINPGDIEKKRTFFSFRTLWNTFQSAKSTFICFLFETLIRH